MLPNNMRLNVVAAHQWCRTCRNFRPFQWLNCRRRACSSSLRFRLTVWHGGMLAIVLIFAATGLYMAARRSFLERGDTGLTMIAHFFARVAEGTPGKTSDAATVMREFENFTAKLDPPPTAEKMPWALVWNQKLSTYSNPMVPYIRIVDPQSGRVLARSTRLQGRSSMLLCLDAVLRNSKGRSTDFFTFADADGKQIMRTRTEPLVIAGKPTVLQIAIPWSYQADILARLALLLCLGVPAIVVFAALGGWILVSRTLQPIDRIVTQARLLDANALPKQLLAAPEEIDSELGQLVATLNDMTTRLHQAFEAQRRYAETQVQFGIAQQRFVADASHELRTPLTILRGEVELVLARPRCIEQYHATLVSALEEIRRMGRIVDGLTMLARGDAGTIVSKDEFVGVDLLDTAYNVVCDFRTQAGEKGIALTLQQSNNNTQSATVCGDPGQLRQLLCNLIDNALKYTLPEGCVTVCVSLRQSTALNSVMTQSMITEEEIQRNAAQRVRVMVEVTDTGIGISDEDLPHIFERFWRADRSRAAGGSGLGLAICAEIVAAHGGTLDVESQLGKGSLFRVELPYADTVTSKV